MIALGYVVIDFMDRSMHMRVVKVYFDQRLYRKIKLNYTQFLAPRYQLNLCINDNKVTSRSAGIE